MVCRVHATGTNPPKTTAKGCPTDRASQHQVTKKRTEITCLTQFKACAGCTFPFFFCSAVVQVKWISDNRLRQMVSGQTSSPAVVHWAHAHKCMHIQRHRQTCTQNTYKQIQYIPHASIFVCTMMSLSLSLYIYIYTYIYIYIYCKIVIKCTNAY